jgi:hypothetical protein
VSTEEPDELELLDDAPPKKRRGPRPAYSRNLGLSFDELEKKLALPCRSSCRCGWSAQTTGAEAAQVFKEHQRGCRAT